MGSSQSQNIQEKNDIVENIYCGFENKEGSTTITKSLFVFKFHENLSELANLIWDRYSRSGLFFLETYKLLINSLRFNQEKLLFIANFFEILELDESSIHLLLKWLTLGRKLDEKMYQLLFKSSLSKCEKVNGIYKVDELFLCLKRKFPDLGEDLVSIILQSLNDKFVDLVQFNLNFEYGQLLNADMLWLLSVILTSPYKRMNETCLSNSAPLEIEQLSHLRCLFNSVIHGLSSTRIIQLSFDYNGPVIMLIRTSGYLFCLTSSVGLKESWDPFGGENSCLYQIYPEFVKLVCDCKTAKRGLLVGHKPMSSPVIEIGGGFNELRYNMGPALCINAIEIWAAGSDVVFSKMQDQKEWNMKQVIKAKERKTKSDNWEDSVDRQMLSMAGIQVHHSDQIEPQT